MWEILYLQVPSLRNQRVHIGEGLTSAMNVGSRLAKDPTSITMGELTLVKGHMNAVIVGNPLAIAPASLNIT